MKLKLLLIAIEYKSDQRESRWVYLLASGLSRSLKFMGAKKKVKYAGVFAVGVCLKLLWIRSSCLTANTRRPTQSAKLVSKLVCSQTSQASLITTWQINKGVGGWFLWAQLRLCFNVFLMLIFIPFWSVTTICFHQLNLINRGLSCQMSCEKTNPASMCHCQWLVQSLANSVI